MNINGTSGKQKRERRTFAKVNQILEMPDLLNVQLEAYHDFLQMRVQPPERKPIGMEQAFLANFPITDAREIFTLEYLDYRMERPKYNVDECRDRELTYATPLKARFAVKFKKPIKSQTIISRPSNRKSIWGMSPMMTDRGTFVINGAERVVVSQLHRSTGRVFSLMQSILTGHAFFSARIIPFRGSWVEFTTDIQKRDVRLH